MKRGLVIVCALVGALPLARAGERYVSVDGSGDGSSSGSPMASLAEAYAQVAEGATKDAPGIVHLKSGMYRLSSAIEMKPYVKVIGDTEGPTIISGECRFDGQHVYHWCRNQGAEESKLTKNPLWNADLSFNEPNPDNGEYWFCAYTGRSPVNCPHAFEATNLLACDNVFENITFTLFNKGAVSVTMADAGSISFANCGFYGDHVYATTTDDFCVSLVNCTGTFSGCEFVGCVGGIRFGGSAPGCSVTNCTFRENSGTSCIAFKDSACGMVSQCVFTRNWTQANSYAAAIVDQRSRLAGMASVEIADCQFISNFVRSVSTVFAGTGSISIRRSRFEGNRLSHASTTVFDGKSSSACVACGTGELALFDCSFVENVSEGSGYAVLLSTGANNDRTVQAVNCSFLRNRATNPTGTDNAAVVGRSNGGMVFVHCAFAGNVTEGTGAYLMYNDHKSATTNPAWVFVNTIVVPETGKPVLVYKDPTRTFTAYNSVLTGLDLTPWTDAGATIALTNCAFDDPVLAERSVILPDGREMVQLARNSPYCKSGLSRVYFDYDESFWMYVGNAWWSQVRSNSKRPKPTSIVLDETGLIPDALGQARLYGKVALGPLNVPKAGLMLLFR